MRYDDYTGEVFVNGKWYDSFDDYLEYKESLDVDCVKEHKEMEMLND